MELSRVIKFCCKRILGREGWGKEESRTEVEAFEGPKLNALSTPGMGRALIRGEKMVCCMVEAFACGRSIIAQDESFMMNRE